MSEKNLFVAVIAISVAIVIIAVAYCASAWILMILWNYVAPIFHGPTLTFLQALAIDILISIIGGYFKSTTKSK